MRIHSSLLGAATAAFVLAATSHAIAHGVVGARFFPATISSDDPFAADELALPTITFFDHETDYDFDYSKTIVPGFAVSLGIGYADAKPPGGTEASGFTNLTVTPALELVRNTDHEFILTGAFIWEAGGTGARAVADRSSSYTPELLFGKGFGDLPEGMALLRPLAVTGQVGFSIAGTRASPDAIQWAGALEYSLLYLQNNVRDQGFGKFVAHLTPVVEFSMTSPTDGSGTTGTINPGLFWSGQYTQLGAEAMIPVNGSSGRTIGAIMQLHFYMDDLFPDSLGRPIFEAGG